MRLIKIVTVTIFLLAAVPALAQITVDQPWARATPPGAKIGAGYMVIRNGGRSMDRLVGASTTVAQRVELHMTEADRDVARMRPVKAYEIVAGRRIELKPGGAHLMLVNLSRPLREGDKVPVTLKFEKAGEVQVEMDVRPLGASSHDQHKGH